MSKDNYNIDSILSEVQKRREENEKKIKEQAKAEQEASTEETPAEAVDEEIPEEPAEESIEETAEEAKIEEESPVEEPEVEEGEAPEEPAEEEFVLAENIEEDAQPVEENAEEVVDAVQAEAPIQEEYEELADDELALKKAKRAKSKKIIKGIIITLVVLIVGAVAFGAIYFNGLLNDIIDNKPNSSAEEERWAGMDSDEENFTPIYETEATELSSLQDMMKMWYYNGSPASKSKVLNVLLLGEDTRGSEIKEEGTRADSAIICSINVETKEITLTSVLRDAYCYFETTPNDGTTGQFSKINAAMSFGDVHSYINTIENLYKINIDNYVIVNFTSFKKIVDILGGVWIDITDKEINEINRNYHNRYGGVQIEKDFEGSHGEMKLTGRQALAYCRIRHIDSDTKRADRQKTVLIQLFEQSKRASKTQLIKIVRQMIPYVATGFSKQEIIKIAKYALTEKWLSFDTKMQSVPSANVKGGTFYGAWCWKCDFPQDAYNLQMQIYGKSNITLAHVRPVVAKCTEKGFYSEGAPAMQGTMTNENYGEVTTLPAPVEETTDETSTSN